MRALIKRVCVLFLCICIILTVKPIKTYAASSDNEAPIVKSITIDKKDVVQGDTITVTVDVEDESGISKKTAGFFMQFSNNGIKSPYMYFKQTDDGKYKASLAITDSYLNGKYSVSFFYVEDVIGNSASNSNLSGDLFSDVYFNVSGGTSDNKAPEVKSITIDKKDVVQGDTITVTVDVEDESGISKKTAGFFMQFSNNGIKSPYMYFKQTDDGKYKASLTITDSYPNGKYSVFFFYVEDLIGNSVSNSDLSGDLFSDVCFFVNEKIYKNTEELNATASDKKIIAKTQKITIAKIRDYKVKSLKKKKVVFSLKAKTSGNGKLTYKVTKGKSKYITVSKTGKVTLKKGCKKGTYKITIMASATKKYKKATKVISIKVK